MPSTVLVTTSFSVLSIDLDTHDVQVVHRGDGLYFGIAARQTVGGWYVAARRRMMSQPELRESERGVILVFDDGLELVDVLEPPFPVRDLHGIAAFDGRLWATSSRDDFVAIYDGNVWTRWIPFPESWKLGMDAWHFNTIVPDDQEVRVVAHRHGPSELHFFDRTSLNHIRKIDLGELAHNSWVAGAEHLTCSSGEGALVGSLGFRLETGGFPRGFCQLPNGRQVVGINEYAPRDSRDETLSRLVVFDESWNQVDELTLPGEGMLLEIVRRAPSDLKPIFRQAAPRAAWSGLLSTIGRRGRKLLR